MAKLSLTNVGSITNQPASVQTTINNNNDLVEAALENTLSRDGTSPNEMETSLDMNSNPIINLPEATTSTEPLRKAEFDEFTTEFLVSGSVLLSGAPGPLVTNEIGVAEALSMESGELLIVQGP